MRKRGTPPDVRAVGFRPLDMGALSTARYMESLTMRVARLAYERPDGPKVAYRFERFPGRAS